MSIRKVLAVLWIARLATTTVFAACALLWTHSLFETIVLGAVMAAYGAACETSGEYADEDE